MISVSSRRSSGASSAKRHSHPSFAEVAKSVSLTNKFVNALKNEQAAMSTLREHREANRLLFYQETTFHALAYLGSSISKLARYSWGLTLVVGCAALIWSAQILLNDFLLTPSQVNVKVMTPEGLKLPEVSVCSLRRINKTRANEIGLNTTETVDYLYGSFAQLVGFGMSESEIRYFNDYVNVPSVRNQYNGAYLRWVNSKNNKLGYMDPGEGLGHMLKYLSQKCIKGVTFRCMLSGTEVEDCCSAIGHFRNYNGPCFRMIFLREFEQTVGGIREGFVGLFEPPPEEIYVDSVFNVHTNRGLQLFFHPFSAGIELDPIYLSEGSDYSIELSIRETNLLPDGDSVCTDVQYTEENRTVVDPYPYCMYVCLSNLFIETCGCQPINNLFSMSRPAPYCGPEDIVTCASRKGKTLKEDNPAYCTENCPYACRQFDYFASVSTVNFHPTPEHARILATNNSRAIRFAVYYPRIQYTIFKEIETISVFNFFSNLGGALGIWTGASAVSILHVIKYVAYSLRIRLDKKRLREERKMELRQAEKAILRVATKSTGARKKRY